MIDVPEKKLNCVQTEIIARVVVQSVLPNWFSMTTKLPSAVFAMISAENDWLCNSSVEEVLARMALPWRGEQQRFDYPSGRLRGLIASRLPRRISAALVEGHHWFV